MRHPLDRLLGAVLTPAEVYVVGGRVRDEIRTGFDGIARTPKDLDYVVAGLSVDELLTRLATVGRVNVVGASFAVVKFHCDVGQADIALPRREHSTGAGHRDFEVEAGLDIAIEEDLKRRDFRMNMLARRLSDDVMIDPYAGIADIAARRIDIVADGTFHEDPLRLLRAAQFAARFEFSLSDRALTAMRSASRLVATVSAERIGDEMTKLLVQARKPSIGLEILRETGVLEQLWPELLEGVGVDQNEWHAFDVYRHNLVTADAAPPGDLELRLAALFHDVGKPRTKEGPHFYRHEQVGADLVPNVLNRLRLPNAVVETVKHLVRQHMYSADPTLTPRAVRRFIQRIGAESLERLFALRAADIIGSGLPKRDDSNERFEERVFAIAAQAPALSVKDLAVGGRDIITLLIARGLAQPDYKGDRRVGTILNALFENVTDNPELNTREGLLTLAADVVTAKATLEK